MYEHAFILVINFLKMWTIGILYNALMNKIEFGRVSQDLFTRILKKFNSYFSKWYCIFYAILKFILISRKVNEIEK
jgi:hypothetical protein